MRRIAVLDAPSNLGLRPPTVTSVPGCAKAPGALRDHGLIAKLDARDAGCLTPPRYDAGDWRPGDGVAMAPQIAAYSRALADRIGAILDAGEFPVVLGGDCSIVLGSGLAMNRLGEAVGGRIGLVFVDGHSDFRHPGNASYVGAAAGEDLALVTGRGQADLAAIEGRRPYFRDIDVVVMGIRAQDEYRLDLQAAGIVTRPVPALRAEGAARSAQWARDQLVDCAGYWVHVDVDVLDPAVMPAVDAPSPGGIAFPELELLLAGLVESPHCLGVEITVFDPDYDSDGSYAAEIVNAVTAGLAAAHTVSARPDLIAARADLNRPEGAPSLVPAPRAEPADAPAEPAADLDHDFDHVAADAGHDDAGSVDGGPSVPDDFDHAAADADRAEPADDPRAEPLDDSRAAFVDNPLAASVDDGRAESVDEPRAEPVDDARAEPAGRPERAEAVGGLRRPRLADRLNGLDLTAGFQRPQRAAGLNRSGSPGNGGDGSEEAGGLNRDRLAGGLNRDGLVGGLNRDRLAGGLNRDRLVGGLSSISGGAEGSVSDGAEGSASDGAALDEERFAEERERQHRRAAAADDSVSLAAAGMSDGLPGAPDEVAIPATTLLGVEEGDEVPAQDAGFPRADPDPGPADDDAAWFDAGSPQADENGQFRGTDEEAEGDEATDDWADEPAGSDPDDHDLGRRVPRPLGQAPLLDSEPLPATRPGMLRPRSAEERESFSLPVQRPAFELGSGEPADIA